MPVPILPPIVPVCAMPPFVVWVSKLVPVPWKVAVNKSVCNALKLRVLNGRLMVLVNSPKPVLLFSVMRLTCPFPCCHRLHDNFCLPPAILERGRGEVNCTTLTLQQPWLA